MSNNEIAVEPISLLWLLLIHFPKKKSFTCKAYFE